MNLRVVSRFVSVVTPAAALLLPLPARALPAEAIFGRWLTDDHAAIVAVRPCGEKLCGRIEKILDPKAPENDVNNPDPDRRSRSLVGTPIFWSFVQSGSGWTDGRAYDPKTGNIYRSKLIVLENGKLKVTGCVLFLCRSRYWTPAIQTRN